jgi:hypothetical protein
MIQSDAKGARIELDALEENPGKYIGQTVSIDGDVEDVLGPRLFTIDEANWGDLDGELLVFLPSADAAFVRADDRVTITGTVKQFVEADVERQWGWFGLDPRVEVTFRRKPVIVASRIVGGNNDLAMIIDTNAAADKPVGTFGTGTGPLTALAEVADGDEALVGRQVQLSAAVQSTAKGGGFLVQQGDNHLLILPSKNAAMNVGAGDRVSIEGVVLQMPRDMEDRLGDPNGLNDDIYVFATKISK